MCNAAGGLLSAHGLGNPLLQSGVKSGAPADSCRKARGILYKCTAQSLHMKDSRYVVRTVFHDNPLHIPLPPCRLLQCSDPAHLQCAHFPDAKGRVCRNLFHVIVRFAKRKNAVDLRHFLVKVQLRQKRGSALLRRSIHVLIHFFHINLHVAAATQIDVKNAVLRVFPNI